MTPEAVAWIIVQAIRSGVDIYAIMREVNATGEVSQQTWDNIQDDIRRANQQWENR